MRTVRAAILGTVAAGVLAYTVATAAVIVVASSGSVLDLGLGPVAVLSVDQLPDDGGTVTTLGPGLIVVALVGGLANAVAAFVIARRERRRPGRAR